MMIMMLTMIMFYWARPLRAVCAGRDNSCFSNLDFSLDRDSRLGAWGVVGCGGAKRGGIGGVGVRLGLGGGWDLHMVTD